MTDHFDGGDLKTSAKLVILEEYLDVYTTIMDSNWRQDKWYVDTHSGTGRTVIDDNGVTIDGSAIIALENHQDSFDRFYFYELSEAHFHKLHETISDRLGLEFDVSPAGVEGEDFLVARCDDPYIRVMQMDSNRGVSFLADVNTSSHWFTFVDPKGLTAKKSTLDTLIGRSNMDILINYQTTGVLRSAAEGAEHAHGAVERTMGDSDWPNAASADEYVNLYKEKLEENPEIRPVKTKALVSPHDARHRFDLAFTCENKTARGIMEDIMNQERLWEKANERIGQSGLGSFG
ncbi:three-Cys-motif partner protein TcmP [Saliphagus sp. GCM10025334]|uniref:three-Cys-motif partner protein TcmP n=1 Tax=Natronosalvus caseinilyticus TaxID=2953747 RepID=UPI0028AE4372|nr:three-Cys-motif partner protein TcmP [Natronosalvus caseinilyticus]